ncbi:MAG TPA: glycosyltransferase family 4 protein, partial [Chitinophagaceae bacterium]|nr:glycosyltransferase family 4 protein [Chitinophagaceae bacterium]
DQLITLKKADSIIAVSTKGFHTLKDRYKVDPKNLQLVYNGIDLKKFFISEREERIPVVAMVAHLSVFKGWFDFLAIIERLMVLGLKFKAWIIGEGELKKELELEVQKKKLNDVVLFKGNVNDVNLCMAFIDVFLFTSHREGLSVAVIEALASGLPIVATNVGGIHEQVEHNKNGFIFRLNQLDEMVNAVSYLLENRQMRTIMGKASRKIAEQKFSEEQMVSSYVSIYRELVKE